MSIVPVETRLMARNVKDDHVQHASKTMCKKRNELLKRTAKTNERLLNAVALTGRLID